MRMLALFVAFSINFILLFYKVSYCVTASANISIDIFGWSVKLNDCLTVLNCLIATVSQVSSSSVSEEEEKVAVLYDSSGDLDEEGPLVNDNTSGSMQFVLEESTGYMEPSLRFLSIAHTLISFCCIIGYYCLKVQQLTGNRQPISPL